MPFRMQFPVLCAYAGASLLATSAAAQDILPLSSKVTCSSCRIVFDTVAVMGDADGPGSLPSLALLVAHDSRGRFFVYQGYSNELQVFSPTGKFIARVSRPGSGPGELGQIGRVLIGPGDTVHVFDNTLSRWTLFSPDLAYVRSVPTAFGVQTVPALVLASGELLISQDVRNSRQFGFPLHTIARSGSVARSFGALTERGEYRSDIPDMLRRLVAAGPGGDVWAAHRARYRLDLVDPATGRIVRVLYRDVRWFPETDQVASSDFTLNNPPRTLIFDVMVDQQGRLWTHVSVADSRWKSAVRQRDATHIDILDRARYYDAIIEVPDPRTRTVVASVKFDDSPGRFLGPDMMYGTRETDDGLVQLYVVRATLQSR